MRNFKTNIMSRNINENIRHHNLYCGYALNGEEQRVLTELSLLEMNKPQRERRSAIQLVSECRNIVKYKSWVKNN